MSENHYKYSIREHAQIGKYILEYEATTIAIEGLLCISKHPSQDHLSVSSYIGFHCLLCWNCVKCLGYHKH